eukprot:173472-Hanusia_phi.AAC.3
MKKTAAAWALGRPRKRNRKGPMRPRRRQRSEVGPQELRWNRIKDQLRGACLPLGPAGRLLEEPRLRKDAKSAGNKRNHALTVLLSGALDDLALTG